MTDQPVPLPVFPGPAPAVTAEHCINRRFRQIDCARCQDACPAQAIQLVDQAPVLEEAACVRCGACLHVCLTEVFDQAPLPEQRLVKSAAAVVETSLSVICPQHPTPGQTTTSAAVVLRHTRCLAGLSIENMLTLSRDGERRVWLDDSPCPVCPLSANHIEIRQRAAAADALLSAAGRPRAIELASGHAAPAVRLISRLVVDGSQPKLSRRGLFTSFLPAAPEGLPAEPPEPEPTRWSQGKRLPPRRRALLRRLRRSRVPAAASSPFRGILVDADRCSACELCARFCPTDALQLVKDGATFALLFEAARCVDCGICSVACPDDAVHVGDALPMAALVSEAVALAAGPLQPCRRCGMPTAVRPGDPEPLCHTCRHRVVDVRPLHDGAGLVADLLQRERDLYQSPASEDDHNDKTHP